MQERQKQGAQQAWARARVGNGKEKLGVRDGGQDSVTDRTVENRGRKGLARQWVLSQGPQREERSLRVWPPNQQQLWNLLEMADSQFLPPGLLDPKVWWGDPATCV